MRVSAWVTNSTVLTLEAHDTPLSLQEDDSLLSPPSYAVTLKVCFLPPPLLSRVLLGSPGSQPGSTLGSHWFWQRVEV